ncbi:MAG: metallophosphoesterase [Thaumarchaeota archaeon]|nr:metallophosphoesterase [Nitrososphaerota archaeon]MDE1818074.1 metallophosphoesterase [Nitrososphaerota archaeon]MDE1875298.1 metallophosphoesterase [Nitrososphaerota archaeon]
MVKTRIVPSQPALILEDTQRFLVVTDLHIGFEIGMISNDINVRPEGMIEEIHSTLDSLIKSEKPDSLIILGDIKSGIDSISKIEWQAVPMFFEIGKRINTLVIPGNHDGNLAKLIPDYVSMTGPSGLVIGDTLLTHGHVMPSENFSQVDRIVMGHLHPVYFQEGSVLDGQRLWVSIKTKKQNIFPSTKGDLEIIIVPSFNKYFYATHKRYHKKSISPILERIRKDNSAKIVTLDGSIIGDESILENII